MTDLNSAIYRCRITHRRSRPRRHHLSYGAFYLLLDIDELDRLDRNSRWFSCNRFNLLSFYNRDHGPGEDAALRPWVEAQLEQAAIALDGGRIEVLCLPRILGYAFNPLTVYYCHDRSNRICAILYEVSNTFGERHTYLFPIEGDDGQLLRHDCAKRLYVSPFMDVAGRYNFGTRQPGETLFLHIHQTDADGPLLDAWVRGEREPMTDRLLIQKLWRYPLLTIKVIAGIHWEALKLWLKGVGLRPRPAAPNHAVTIVRPDAGTLLDNRENLA
jgi:DUF1365 family protein